MAKMATKHSPRQLERRRDRERIMFGIQGAASSVRHVDWASVDTAALVAQLDQRAHAPRRRCLSGRDHSLVLT